MLNIHIHAIIVLTFDFPNGYGITKIMLGRAIALFFLFSAIISLFSVEGFRQGSSHNSGRQSQSKLGSALHQYEVDLPASYGRMLISDEEMDIINVRIGGVVHYHTWRFE
jgi:hypothetical protein